MLVYYKGTGMQFVSCVLIWFGYQGDVGLVECVWKFFILHIFNNLRKTDIASSLNVWQNSSMKPSCHELFLIEGFLLLSLITSYYSVHDSVLVRCTCLETCSCLLGYQFCWQITFYNNLQSFLFLQFIYSVSPFAFHFYRAFCLSLANVFSIFLNFIHIFCF